MQIQMQLIETLSSTFNGICIIILTSFEFQLVSWIDFMHALWMASHNFGFASKTVNWKPLLIINKLYTIRIASLYKNSLTHLGQTKSMLPCPANNYAKTT